MKLNTLRAENWDKTKWCGPTALSIITGRTLKYCHNKLARLEFKKPRYLKGVSNYSMLCALSNMGYKHERVQVIPGRTTLRRYVEEIQSTDEFRSVMLINVTSHYVVLHKGMVADNRNDGTATPVRNHHAWRKQIKRAWIIRKR